MAPRFKLVLRSYLKDGYPPIGSAAELARTSVRSLQRELAQSGVSYSDLVQHVRFEQATRLQTQDRTKVIDVALSLGYEDASHFREHLSHHRREPAAVPHAKRRGVATDWRLMAGL